MLKSSHNVLSGQYRRVQLVHAQWHPDGRAEPNRLVATLGQHKQILVSDRQTKHNIYIGFGSWQDRRLKPRHSRVVPQQSIFWLLERLVASNCFRHQTLHVLNSEFGLVWLWNGCYIIIILDIYTGIDSTHLLIIRLDSALHPYILNEGEVIPSTTDRSILLCKLAWSTICGIKNVSVVLVWDIFVLIGMYVLLLKHLSNHAYCK